MPGLSDLPSELLLMIFYELDFPSASSLARTDQRLRSVFRGSRGRICFEVTCNSIRAPVRPLVFAFFALDEPRWASLRRSALGMCAFPEDPDKAREFLDTVLIREQWRPAFDPPSFTYTKAFLVSLMHRVVGNLVDAYPIEGTDARERSLLSQACYLDSIVYKMGAPPEFRETLERKYAGAMLRLDPWRHPFSPPNPPDGRVSTMILNTLRSGRHQPPFEVPIPFSDPLLGFR